MMVYWVLAIFLFDYSRGAFFDYTDFDDPLQILLNTRNQVAREPNSPCSGIVSKTPMEGVCKSRAECRLTGGVTSDGLCGLLATCCVYMGRCGSRLSTKISYFQSTDGANSPTCTYQVKLHNKNICQLRLDFVYMNLAPTATTGSYIGTCRDERFTIEGHPEVPQICGINTGQHVYIPVNGNDTTPVTLRVDLLPEAVTNRGWTIKITQLQCPGTSIFPYRTQLVAMVQDSKLLAPDNCLQYYTNSKGWFKSFGYDALNPMGSSYSIGQSYAICFKRSQNACGISYTADYFNVGTAVTPAGADDYLYIPALNKEDTFIDGKITGKPELNQVFASVTPGPLYVYFLSDSNPDSDSGMGFNIKYELSTVCS